MNKETNSHINIEETELTDDELKVVTGGSGANFIDIKCPSCKRTSKVPIIEKKCPKCNYPIDMLLMGKKSMF